MNRQHTIKPFISDNGKWGYKDADGNIIISPEYEYAKPCNDNICWVKSLYWGGLNLKGEMIVPFIYRSVSKVSKNLFRVMGFNGKFGAIDSDGRICLETKYDLIEWSWEGILSAKIGTSISFVDRNGNKILEEYREVYPASDSIDTQFFRLESDRHDYIGYNNFIFSIDPDLWIENCNDSFIVGSKEHEFHVYNNKGQLVLKQQFNTAKDSTYTFLDDTLFVSSRKENDLYIYNLSNQFSTTIHNVELDKIIDNKYIKVRSIDDRIGIIDNNGKFIISCTYRNILDYLVEGKFLVVAKDDQSWGLIDISQNIFIPMEYTSLKSCGEEKNNWLIAEKEGVYGIINLKNDIIIDFCYDSIEEYHEGIAIVRKNNNVGAIGIEGNIVIPIKYYDVIKIGSSPYEDEYFYRASNHGRSDIYDIYGNLTLKDISSETLKYEDPELFYHVERDLYNTKYICGVYNMYGDIILPYNYVSEDNKIYIALNDDLRFPLRAFHLPSSLFDFNVMDYKVDVKKLQEESCYHNYDRLSNEEIEQIYNREYHFILGYEGLFIVNWHNISCVINSEGDIIFILYGGVLRILSRDEKDIILYSVYEEECNQYGHLDFIPHLTVCHNGSQEIYIDSHIGAVSTILGNKLQNKFLEINSYYRLCTDIRRFKSGLVDNQNRMILPIEYDSIQIMGRFMLVIKSQICYVLLDFQKIIYHFEYSKDSYSYSYPKLEKSYNEIILRYDYRIKAIFDRNGKILITGSFFRYKIGYIIIVETEKRERDYWDENDDGYLKAIYDKEYRPLYPHELYDKLDRCNRDMLLGKREGQYILFNNKGEKLFTTDNYSAMDKFTNGTSVVCCNNRYGVIDIHFNEIVPCLYDNKLTFKRGFSEALRNGKFGVVDIHGKEIIPCIYERILKLGSKTTLALLYNQRVRIHNDGTTESVLLGNIIINGRAIKGASCQIIDGCLQFRDNYNKVLTDFLNIYDDELLVFTYSNGHYHLLNEPVNQEIHGTVFLVNKAGQIIHWGETPKMIRISSQCVLLGRTELANTKLQSSCIEALSDKGTQEENLLVFLNGVKAKYITTVNSKYHIALSSDYVILNNEGHILWEQKNISAVVESNGNIIFFCFMWNENDEERYRNRRYKINVLTWNSGNNIKRCIETKRTNSVEVSEIKFTEDMEYMIIPYFSGPDCYENIDLYLTVINRQGEITIDNYFPGRSIKAIFKDKILLYNSSDYSCNYKLYGLYSLKENRRIASSRNRHYFKTEEFVEESKCNTYWRNGIYDITIDKQLVPTIYVECEVVYDVEDGICILVTDENKKKGLYHNDRLLLECIYDSMEYVSILPRAERNNDNIYNQPNSHNTKYLLFKNDEEIGILYRGNIIWKCKDSAINNIEIKGIDPILTNDLDVAGEFLLIRENDTTDIYYKGKLLGTYHITDIQLTNLDPQLKNGYCYIWLRLIDGDSYGLLAIDGSYYPIKKRKIYICNYHICVVGDKVYELDKKTVFLGSQDESLVSAISRFNTIEIYAFKTKSNGLVFYNETKEKIKYTQVEEKDGICIYFNDYDYDFTRFSIKEQRFYLINDPDMEYADDDPEEDYVDDFIRVDDNPYYDDNLDMDQQSEDFWNSIY